MTRYIYYCVGLHGDGFDWAEESRDLGQCSSQNESVRHRDWTGAQVKAAEAVRSIITGGSGTAPGSVLAAPMTRGQPLLPTTSNTCSPTWVFVYQPPLAFDPPNELAKGQYLPVALSNGRGTSLVMLTNL